MSKINWHRILRILIWGIPLVIGIGIFCFWQNNDIVITKHEYVNSEIPKAFNDLKIVHISDLHNKRFGKNQEKILSKIRESNPDIIVITGDLIDRRKYNLEVAMEFIKGAKEIAPIYYVAGNHEAWSGKYSEIKNNLIKSGVNVLDDDDLELTRENEVIYILGLKDPDFLTSSYIDGTDTSEVELKLKEWKHRESFKILLSHRPELFNLYCANDIDMIFSGHAHGGQFRTPFGGGLIAPDQGFFPKYTSGKYENNKSTMFVSRGLGNSVIPIRIFNRPEIVEVTLINNE